MSKKKGKITDEVKIIAEGMAAGILAGIGFNMGMDIDRGGIYLFFVKMFCETTGDMIGIGHNCWSFYGLISTLIIVITTFSIFSIIRKSKRIFRGALIYVSGFIIGFLFILLFV